MKSLVDGVDSLCLIKECRDLENIYGTRYTDEIMTDAEGFSVRLKGKVLRLGKRFREMFCESSLNCRSSQTLRQLV